MTSFLGELRYASRVLLRSRTTTAIAVVALALGIGVNASSFISIDAMVLHPLAYPRLERIVTVWGTVPKVRTQRTPLSPADFVDLRRQNHSFAAIGAYRDWQASLTGQSAPERVQASLVTPEFFAVLGMRPELGRTFEREQEQAGPGRVVVVSDGFWKTHLAGSHAAIGKAVSLNGANYIVIGVMPDSFDLPLTNEIWTPLSLDAEQARDREHHNLFTIGLLKPGVSVQEARADVAGIAGRLEREYARTNQERSLLIDPIRNLAERVTGRFVLTLFGAAGFVLLLACANVGNLQLARATNREREIAVRAALGASRFQIAREMQHCLCEDHHPADCVPQRARAAVDAHACHGGAVHHRHVVHRGGALHSAGDCPSGAEANARRSDERAARSRQRGRVRPGAEYAACGLDRVRDRAGAGAAGGRGADGQNLRTLTVLESRF
jgi:putative ABC transport system permease protein